LYYFSQAVERKGTVKLEFLKKIEKEAQEKWEKAKVSVI
jgi:hypothetical protein